MILDFIFGKTELSGTVNPDRWFVEYVAGAKTASGENISEQTALTCAAVKAAVSVLAETIACMPLGVFRSLPGGGSAPAPEHPAHRLLHDEPNEETSSYIWRETLQGHLGTWGNAYSEIERAIDGTPIALHQRLPKPGRTKPKRDEDRRLYYECKDEHGTVEAKVRPRDMLHIPGFGFDGLIGYSPIRLLKESLGVTKAAERYAGEMFANDLRPAGFVTLPGELSKEAYDRTQAAFNPSPMQGQRHRTRLLEGGSTYATAQMNPEDVQMIEARRFGIEDVARAYRVTPHLLADLTHGTFSNITELGRQFIVYTMLPWIARWQGEINRKLLGDGYFCKFNARAFMQGDHTARSNFYQKGIRIGLFSVNDMRALEDMNPIGPAGDVRFVSRDLVPLESAVKGPEPPKPSEPPGGLSTEVAETLEAIRQDYLDVESRRSRRTRQAALGVLRETIGRLLAKEANAAKRAAKQPKTFLAWMDEFYAKHEKLVEEAVGPALELCRTTEVADDEPEAVPPVVINNQIEMPDNQFQITNVVPEMPAPIAPVVNVTPEINVSPPVVQVTNEVAPLPVAGPPGKDGKDGKDGRDAQDGRDGKDGAEGTKGEKGEPSEVKVDVQTELPNREVIHERDREGNIIRSYTRDA